MHKECRFSKCSCFYFSKKALRKKKQLKYTVIQGVSRISEVLFHLKAINIETHFENNKVTAEYVNNVEMAVQDQSLLAGLQYQTKDRV